MLAEGHRLGDHPDHAEPDGRAGIPAAWPSGLMHRAVDRWKRVLVMLLSTCSSVCLSVMVDSMPTSSTE